MASFLFDFITKRRRAIIIAKSFCRDFDDALLGTKKIAEALRDQSKIEYKETSKRSFFQRNTKMDSKKILKKYRSGLGNIKDAVEKLSSNEVSSAQSQYRTLNQEEIQIELLDIFLTKIDDLYKALKKNADKANDRINYERLISERSDLRKLFHTGKRPTYELSRAFQELVSELTIIRTKKFASVQKARKIDKIFLNLLEKDARHNDYDPKDLHPTFEGNDPAKKLAQGLSISDKEYHST